MRRFLTFVLTFALAGTALMAAGEKAKTPADMDAAMKKVGTTQQALNKAIQAMAYADAKKQVEILKTTLTDAENFWVVNKKADAQQFSKDVLAKLDVLDKTLAEKTPDQAKATAAYRDAATTCNSCHKVYRGVDANNQFVIKPGTV
jgi:cytochrome c556